MNARTAPDYAAFTAANRSRSRNAATLRVRQARAVLDQPVVLTDVEHQVLAARIAFPDDSLAHIAATLGMTKHAYAAALRRALHRHALPR